MKAKEIDEKAREIDGKVKEMDAKVREAAAVRMEESESSAVKKLKDLPVRRKLTVLSRTFIGGMIMIAVFGALGLWMVSSQANVVSKRWMPSVMLAQDMDAVALDYQRLTWLQKWSRIWYCMRAISIIMPDGITCRQQKMHGMPILRQQKRW